MNRRNRISQNKKSTYKRRKTNNGKKVAKQPSSVKLKNNDKQHLTKLSGKASIKRSMRKNQSILRKNTMRNIEEEKTSQMDEISRQRMEAILKDKEDELVPRKLTCNNSQAPKVIVSYNYLQKNYERQDKVKQHVLHFSLDGETITRDSQFHQDQNAILEDREARIKQTVKEHDLKDENGEYDIKVAREIMRNKFMYSERQTQTPLTHIKERGVSTAKPELVAFDEDVNQSFIFDTYMKEWDRRQKEQEEKENKKDSGSHDPQQGMKKVGENSMFSPSFQRSLKIMERMIVQNNEKQRFHDYKYMFTDTFKDSNKGKEKNMLPLWKFSYQAIKKKSVTSLCWNPKYKDLFAVGYGSYEFGRKKSVGYICLCTLKNNMSPEMTIQTDDHVMSLDFHPQSPALLAVGLYNGVVLVYDIRNKNKQPIYSSSIKTKKHTDPVWQVKWASNEVNLESDSKTDKHLHFYSISSDGRVMNWIMMKDKLEPEEVIRLKLVNKKNKQSDEETSLISLACGLCFDFNPFDPNIFIVGTEEGNIHKCSRAYSGQYQETYEGHQLAVYKVRWNPYHKRTFISASADWTIKIWDCDIRSPIMSFDLQQAMVDVVWSPFNSAVFIALSLNKTFAYDLEVQRHTRKAEIKPINCQMTNLSFNPVDPIFLVGDKKGTTIVIKLSQTLAKPVENPKDPEFMKQEHEKMENLLLLGNFDRDEEEENK